MEWSGEWGMKFVIPCLQDECLFMHHGHRQQNVVTVRRRQVLPVLFCSSDVQLTGALFVCLCLSFTSYQQLRKGCTCKEAIFSLKCCCLNPLFWSVRIYSKRNQNLPSSVNPLYEACRSINVQYKKNCYMSGLICVIFPHKNIF